MRYIAVDAMGGDNAPREIVRGCAAAVSEGILPDDFAIIITGQEKLVSNELERCHANRSKIEVLNADDVISAAEAPTAAIKNKKNSSMVVGLNLVKNGSAGAFVSAGNTGALLAGATLIVGRAEGVLRPALGTPLPGVSGFSFLIDAGANVDAKPEYLLQFAQMGAVYTEYMLGVPSPRVGLVNIGAEKEKGNTLTKEAYGLLETSGLNFVGNVESREIPHGAADVIVCDAFVGNVILKHLEGVSLALMSVIKRELTSSGLVPKLGALLSKKAFVNVKRIFDASEVGGAPFLGLKGLVVKAHGNSDAKAVKNAVRQSVLFLQRDITDKIRESIN